MSMKTSACLIVATLRLMMKNLRNCNLCSLAYLSAMLNGIQNQLPRSAKKRCNWSDIYPAWGFNVIDSVQIGIIWSQFRRLPLATVKQSKNIITNIAYATGRLCRLRQYQPAIPAADICVKPWIYAQPVKSLIVSTGHNINIIQPTVI